MLGRRQACGGVGPAARRTSARSPVRAAAASVNSAQPLRVTARGETLSGRQTPTAEARAKNCQQGHSHRGLAVLHGYSAQPDTRHGELADSAPRNAVPMSLRKRCQTASPAVSRPNGCADCALRKGISARLRIASVRPSSVGTLRNRRNVRKTGHASWRRIASRRRGGWVHSRGVGGANSQIRIATAGTANNFHLVRRTAGAGRLMCSASSVPDHRARLRRANSLYARVERESARLASSEGCAREVCVGVRTAIWPGISAGRHSISPSSPGLRRKNSGLSWMTLRTSSSFIRSPIAFEHLDGRAS